MPVARYFIWVGGALLALLLIAGWAWPSAAPDPAPVDEAAAPANPTNSTILRIHSARKWPDKVEFDTSIPTTVPPSPPPPPVQAQAVAPPAPVVADNTAAAAKHLDDARAEMKPRAPSAPSPTRRKVVHHRSPRPAVSTWANAYPPPQQPSWGWSHSSHWSWNW